MFADCLIIWAYKRSTEGHDRKTESFQRFTEKHFVLVKTDQKAIENELTDFLRPLKNVVAEKAETFYFNLKIFRNRFVPSKCQFFERKFVFFSFLAK